MTRPHRTARRLRWALLLVGVVVVVLVGYTGYQALKARTALQQVAADFDTFSTQLTSGETAAARLTIASAQRHAAEARSRTQGPGWWLTSHVPVIGPNVGAVQAVAGVANALSADVLPGVLDASEVLTPAELQPRDGRIDLDPIREATPGVVAAATKLHQQQVVVQRIDTEPLASSIAEPVRELQDKIDRADRLAATASRAVRLLPPMLGGDGRRTYLFLFQNNAEIRATGGIPGAFATITADDGRVRLSRQDDAASIGSFDEPPTPLTKEETAAFSRGMGVFPQDVNFTPDFPRSGELISGMYAESVGKKIDGVISVDPVALSYLLKGTGPIEAAGDRTVTAANAVPLLLQRVYAEIPVRSQDAFFGDVARRVFDRVVAGGNNPRALLEQLSKGVSERRVLVWARRPGEQEVIDATPLAGALPGPSTTAPRVGIYFNSSRASKLEYYLDYGVTVRQNSCRARQQDLTVTVTMTSRVPKPVSKLPEYVASPVKGFSRGAIVTTVFAFMPEGQEFRSFDVGGDSEPYNVRPLGDQRFVARTVTLNPGQSQTLTWRVDGAQGQTRTPELRVTPGVRSTGVGTVDPAAC